MLVKNAITISCAFLFALQSTSAEDSNIIVETSKGKIRGIEELTTGGRKINSFMGIPFAKPPLGSLRFMSPVEPEPWKGILDGTHYKDPCIQDFGLVMPGLKPNPVGSEDCLYLNVFTPKIRGPKKPVMVFVHGGGFMSGAANLYPPLALMDEDIVFVSIQYRLSIFGFLSTDDDVMPGNYGMKDQNLGLRWVKANIAKFGGDPDNVTLFGQSAGGGSVHLQMLSPYSKGLFKRVIAQSGGALCPWSINRNSRKTAEDFGRLVDCPLGENSEEYLECLRKIDSHKLVIAFLESSEWLFFPLGMAPRIDGDFLPEDPARTVKEKRYNKVDFMAGITRDEGSFFLYYMSTNKTSYEMLRKNFSKYGPMSICVGDDPNGRDIAESLYAHYLQGAAIGSEDSIQKLQSLYSDVFFEHCYDIATRLQSENSDNKVYRYEFHHKGKYSFGDEFQMKESKNWIAHLDELFYLFQGGRIFSRPLEDQEELQMRKIFLKLWTNFAKYGDPTPDDSLGFRWDAVSPTDVRHLKITLKPSMEKDNRDKKRKFYRSLPLQQNKILSPYLKEKEEL